jgi:hypothetical protein
MSKALDTETKRLSKECEALLQQVLFHAEAFRLKGATDQRPKSSPYRVSLGGNLRLTFNAPLTNRYLVTLYHSDPPGYEDFHNRRHLGYPESWVLLYDSHHARWKVVAWNRFDGNKGFHRKYHGYYEK